MPRQKASPLGEFEQVVLLAVLRLDDNAYGVTIRKEILECTGRRIGPGALYNCLDRLEDKEMVLSRFGDPTPQRGGRPKRLFTVTTDGFEAVSRSLRAYQRLTRDLVIPGIAHA
jgi:PadR family transcriptional regulator, regulatory protein PadR